MAPRSLNRNSDPTQRRQDGSRARLLTSILALAGASAVLWAAPALAGAAPSAYSWGWNAFGQLGNGTLANASTPAPVATGAVPATVNITQTAMGAFHTVALGSDGQLYTWGYNNFGQLGNGTTTESTVPVVVSPGAIPAGTTFTQVAAGAYDSLALSSSGKVYAWGYGANGELGNGATNSSSVPVAVALPGGATNITQIAAGSDHNLAVTSTGKVYAWGYGDDGELGNGGYSSSSVPVLVSAGTMPAGTTITQVSAGVYHSLALSSAGAVYAWGYNSSGQLGNGSTNASAVPVAVSPVPVGGTNVGGTNITHIAAGGTHSLVLSSTGQVYAFGSNSSGQLGNGATNNSSVPVAVSPGAMPAGTTISNVAGSYIDSAALSSTGQVYTWGDNSFGQLGDGLTASSSVPVAVSLVANTFATSIAQGSVARSAVEIVGISTSTTTTVNGNVPSTLALSVSNVTPVLGPFIAGVAGTYNQTLAATVTSSAASATLSAADGCTPVAPETTTCYPGYLVNNTATGAPYPLVQPLQVEATSGNSAATSTSWQVLTSPSSVPPYSATLLSYNAPVSLDSVTVGFQQVIGANDPLRTGSYTKTITFTLATTHP